MTDRKFYTWEGNFHMTIKGLEMLREENRRLNLREYSDGRTKLISRPRYVLVELTQGCNLRCPMCRPDIIPTKGMSMSRERFGRIANELFPTAEMVDLRGWGESLILPDVEEFIRTTARYGTTMRFVTNLSFHRDEVLDCLAEFGCHVAVSFDTADPNLFSHLRHGANLAQVSRNIEHLLDRYRKHSQQVDLVYLTCTVQSPALKHLSDIIDFAANRGVREVRIFGVTAGSQSELSLANSTEEVDLALGRVATRALETGVRVFVGTRLGSMPENPLGGPACIHPWAYAAITFDGHVGFCDHLIGPDGASYLIGNLDTSTFEQIWNGPEWKELRREHLTTRRSSANKFHECDWCYRNRYIDFEHLFEPGAEHRRVTITKWDSQSKTEIGGHEY
jgi:radical SAM protein with 4Fe4S-binding SPASM domain